MALRFRTVSKEIIYEVTAIIYGPLSDYVTVERTPNKEKAERAFDHYDARYRYVKLTKLTTQRKLVKRSNPSCE